MTLFKCEINDLNCSKNWIATNVADPGAILSITDVKLYVPVVTISTQNNAKPLEQLKSGFKRTISWHIY